MRQQYSNRLRSHWVQFLVIPVVMLLVSACDMTNTETVNGHVLYLSQHSATLNLAAGETNTSTVSCQNGEQLMSGGYGTIATSLPGRAVFIHASMPTDSAGNPPTSSGVTLNAWTVTATNTTTASFSLSTFVYCLSGLNIAPQVYRTDGYVSTFNQALSTPNQPVKHLNGIPHLPQSGDGSFTVNCPTGYLIGGGFQTDQHLIIENLPNAGLGDGWQFGNATMTPGSDRALATFVVCATQNITSVATIHHEQVFTEDPGPGCDSTCVTHRVVNSTVTCPDDTLLTGGGVRANTGTGDIADPKVVQVTTLDEMDGPTSWIGQADISVAKEPNASNTTEGQISARCATLKNLKFPVKVYIEGPIFFIVIPENNVKVGLVPGVDLQAHVQHGSVHQAPSVPQQAQGSGGSPLVFHLTVTAASPTGAPVISPAGRVITNTPGNLTCTTTAAVTISPAVGFASQDCQIHAGAVPATDWLDNSYPGFSYSGSNPAGGSAASYTVPDNCGDATPAKNAAQAALTKQLTSQIPTGEVQATDPTFSFAAASLTCIPAAGTQQATPFTYVQSIDGTATLGTVKPQDIQQFQLTRLQHQAQQKGADYQLGSTNVCRLGPKLTSKDTNIGTFLCAASGTTGFVWTADALQHLAHSIQGKTPQEATDILQHTPGVVSNSVKVSTMGNLTAVVHLTDFVIVVRGI